MTFNEWLEKEYPQIHQMKDSHGVRYWILMAENAWRAASAQQNSSADNLSSGNPALKLVSDGVN